MAIRLDNIAISLGGQLYWFSFAWTFGPLYFTSLRFAVQKMSVLHFAPLFVREGSGREVIAVKGVIQVVQQRSQQSTKEPYICKTHVRIFQL